MNIFWVKAVFTRNRTSFESPQGPQSIKLSKYCMGSRIKEGVYSGGSIQVGRRRKKKTATEEDSISEI